MTAKTFYVSLARNWRGERWGTELEASTERADVVVDTTLIGLWACRATSKREAVGVVAEYLFRGRTAGPGMNVEEMYAQDTTGQKGDVR